MTLGKTEAVLITDHTQAEVRIWKFCNPFDVAEEHARKASYFLAQEDDLGFLQSEQRLQGALKPGVVSKRPLILE